MYTAPERLYLSKDGRIVREDDPEAHVLFVQKGGHVPFQLVRKYGLDQTQAVPEPPEVQARLEPPATTARSRKAR